MSTGEIVSIPFGSTRIHCAVIRSRARRKTMAIQVRPYGEVVVRVPSGTTKAKVSRLVADKAHWIVQKQQVLASGFRRTEKEFISGESFLYLGRHYRLRVKQDRLLPKARTMLSGGFFDVSVPASRSVRVRVIRVRGALLSWYKAHAQSKLGERISLLMAKLEITKTPQVHIRSQERRWGSCSPSGQLRFNWRIIMAPLSLVDYVVLHELCHLRHRNHSREFWSLVRSIMPDYDERIDRLAARGWEYDF